MKRYLFFAFAMVLSTGCSSTIQKNFKVIVDPPDSDIKVISGVELHMEKFQSPAEVSAEQPENPELAAKTRVEVSRDAYKPRTIPLTDIKDGETLTIKLERLATSMILYHLKYRLVSPVASNELAFRDKIIAVQLTVDNEHFLMKLDNVSANPLKILWDQAEYLDVNNRRSRLMHEGIRFQDRNNQLPAQPLLVGASIQEAVMPISLVTFSQQKKVYESQPLFPFNSDAAQGLKGKVFSLFIPVEVDRQIIPYNFKVQIIETTKEIIQLK